MTIQPTGNTRSIPLPEILQRLQQTKATGTLTLCRQNVKKCVHLKSGQIIFATSTDAHDRLGEMLVRNGFLSNEKLDAALKLYQRNAGLKKIGAVLVESGFVSPKDLFAGLKTQVKCIIYSLFQWDDAEYHFEQHLPVDIIELQINLQELIKEIIERMKKEE